MFQRVLTFREGAATALFNDQQITNFDSLRSLTMTRSRSSAARSPRKVILFPSFHRIASSCSCSGQRICGAHAAEWMT
jgi:hypothetical protein